MYVTVACKKKTRGSIKFFQSFLTSKNILEDISPTTKSNQLLSIWPLRKKQVCFHPSSNWMVRRANKWSKDCIHSNGWEKVFMAAGAIEVRFYFFPDWALFKISLQNEFFIFLYARTPFIKRENSFSPTLSFFFFFLPLRMYVRIRTYGRGRLRL